MSLAYDVPLWGGIAANGFAHIAFHKGKKLTIDEWLVAVRSGKFRAAIVRLNPERPNGPWHVLCDNERFMKNTACQAAHRASRIKLWHVM